MPDIETVPSPEFEPFGDWWVMKARPIKRLRKVGGIQEAIADVGDPRDETLGWVCRRHDIWDCPECLPKVGSVEHPFVSRG